MSFIIRDFLSPSVAKFNSNSRLYQRFKKAWPNNGVVYDEQFRWYRGGSVRGDRDAKQFYKSLGTSFDELNRDKPSSGDEVEYIYFALNAGKYMFSVPTKQEIVNYINSAMCTGYGGDMFGEPVCTEYDNVVSVTVDYGGTLRTYLAEHKKEFEIIPDPSGDPTKAALTTTPFNATEIRNLLHSDPWFYFANIGLYEDIKRTIPAERQASQVNTAPNTWFKSLDFVPVTKTTTSNGLAAIFALYDNGSNFSRITQEDGLDYYNEIVYTVSTGLDPCTFNCDGLPTYTTTKGEVMGYKYTIDYHFTPVKTSSFIVSAIQDVCQDIENEYNTPTRYSTAVKEDTTTKSAIYDIPDSDLTDDVWLNGRLRVEAAENFLKRWEFADLFGKCFYSGHKIEDAEWWEKLLGVVIIIVAIIVIVVVFFYTLGASAAATPLIAAAAGVGAGAMTLTFGMLLLSAVGGNSATKIVNVIGVFAQVLGYISMVLGITAWIQGAYQAYAAKAVEQGAVKAAADYTVDQFIKDVLSDMLDSVLDAVTNTWDFMGDLFTGNVNSSPVSLNDVSDFLGNMETGMKVYNEFFNDQELPDTTLQEQTSKSNQFPEDHWLVMEMVIYEPDALQKMDLLKEKNMGGNKTQAVLDDMA